MSRTQSCYGASSLVYSSTVDSGVPLVLGRTQIQTVPRSSRSQVAHAQNSCQGRHHAELPSLQGHIVTEYIALGVAETNTTDKAWNTVSFDLHSCRLIVLQLIG